MRHDAGHECRKNDRVIDPSEIQHFNAEERPGDGSPENGRESSADTADHQSSSILVAQTQDVGEQARQGCPNLCGGALLTD